MNVDVQYADGIAETLRAPEIDPVALNALQKQESTSEQLQRFIDSLDIPAEVKSVVSGLYQLTLSVKGKIIKLGHKLLELWAWFKYEYPRLPALLSLALLISMVVSLVPWIGGILSGFLGPILAACALGSEFVAKLKTENPTAVKAAEQATRIFEPLKGR